MRLETERLVLRPFEERDRPQLRRILGDADVRRFYPGTLDADATDAMIERIGTTLAEHGYSLLSAELRATGQCIGLVGLLPLRDPLRTSLPVAASVEIGWQLDRGHWGAGLAPEAARACLDAAFGPLGLQRVVAFTYEGNAPSRRVMEKLGMRQAGAFLHPALPEDHWLRPHVCYVVDAAD